MNNDNTNTVVESLDYAANKYADNCKYPMTAIAAFTSGANWQKEQLQPLIDSHRELLEALQVILKSHYRLSGGIYSTEEEKIAESAIKKANNIKP